MLLYHFKLSQQSFTRLSLRYELSFPMEFSWSYVLHPYKSQLPRRVTRFFTQELADIRGHGTPGCRLNATEATCRAKRTNFSQICDSQRTAVEWPNVSVHGNFDKLKRGLQSRRSIGLSPL